MKRINIETNEENKLQSVNTRRVHLLANDEIIIVNDDAIYKLGKNEPSYSVKNDKITRSINAKNKLYFKTKNNGWYIWNNNKVEAIHFPLQENIATISANSNLVITSREQSQKDIVKLQLDN